MQRPPNSRPFQPIIMHVLQCPHDVDVQLLFSFFLDLHLTCSQKSCLTSIFIIDLRNFVKICSCQIKTSQSLVIPVWKITKFVLRQIAIFWKPPDIIEAKYSRFTVYWHHIITFGQQINITIFYSCTVLSARTVVRCLCVMWRSVVVCIVLAVSASWSMSTVLRRSGMIQNGSVTCVRSLGIKNMAFSRGNSTGETTSWRCINQMAMIRSDNKAFVVVLFIVLSVTGLKFRWWNKIQDILQSFVRQILYCNWLCDIYEIYSLLI